MEDSVCEGVSKVTIDEIVNSKEAMLTAYDVAEILGSDPATIRLMVQQDPDALKPLGPIRTGNRVKFPRMRFIGWYYGEAMPELDAAQCERFSAK